jgi:hypothetical protein
VFNNDLFWTLIAALVMYGLMIAIHAYCITSSGGWIIAGVEMFVVVPLAALLMARGSLFLLLFPPSRMRALRVLIASAILVLLFLPAMQAAAALRSYGFHLATQRAKPLISAIGSSIFRTSGIRNQDSVEASSASSGGSTFTNK